jgi:hypothetical protein
MVQMYLDIMTNAENNTDASSDILSIIREFELNKKGVIDSLIAQQFSDGFLNFYNTIWFSPCTYLGVETQCTALFSDIINDNLDYCYVYILT